MKVKAKLLVEIKARLEKGEKLTVEMLRNCVEEDLEDLFSYNISSVTIVENTNNLLIEIEADFEDDVKTTAEALRYCVEQDLEDFGSYNVGAVTVVKGTEEIKFDKVQGCAAIMV